MPSTALRQPKGLKPVHATLRCGYRKKNEPLDFVALLELAEQPSFEKLLQNGKRPNRARAAGRALLPEDHHYQVCTYCYSPDCVSLSASFELLEGGQAGMGRERGMCCCV